MQVVRGVSMPLPISNNVHKLCDALTRTEAPHRPCLAALLRTKCCDENDSVCDGSDPRHCMYGSSTAAFNDMDSHLKLMGVVKPESRKIESPKFVLRNATAVHAHA